MLQSCNACANAGKGNAAADGVLRAGQDSQKRYADL
jgi:hypothetical protein